MSILSIKDKMILIKAIENSDILPSGQKKVLSIIGSADYPVTAKQIEKAMGYKKQTVNFTLKHLLNRNFIEREKDGVYIYTPNKDRAVELIERYKTNLINQKN